MGSTGLSNLKMTRIEVKRDRVSVPLAEDESVSGILDVPEGFVPGEGTGVILAHGAGKDMESPFMLSLARGLSRGGCLTMRFNFPYKEKGKKAPDPQRRLEETWFSAFNFFKKNTSYSPKRIFAAGKSMGGRIASVLAARDGLPVEGLIFYGYPLHAPGKTEKLRDAHLYLIDIPMLFFAGTRDPLCNIEKLRDVLGKIRTPWILEVIEGGEHSFKVLKSLGIDQEEIYVSLTQKTIDWIKQI